MWNWLDHNWSQHGGVFITNFYCVLTSILSHAFPNSADTVRPERRGATDFLGKEVRPQLHWSVNSIGFESRSGFSFGCVRCHIAVFTEQLHHTSSTVCVDVLILMFVVVFVRLSQTHWLSRWRNGRRLATVRSQWLRHGPGMVCLRRSELQRLALIPAATKDVPVSTVFLLTLDIP